MGGKAGPKRVVQLRVKWGENRDSRGEAASTVLVGGKAGPKRVVQLRVKWGENRDSRGEAASTSGFAARNRLPGFQSFSFAAHKIYIFDNLSISN